MESLATTLLHLFLCLSVVVLPSNAGGHQPSSCSLASTCMATPLPDLCMREMGPRMSDAQGALPHALRGEPDFAGLVEVAIQAAAEAGAVAAAMVQGKLPGFNTTLPDFKHCLGNCNVTVNLAVRKLHGAAGAMRANAYDVAAKLASRAISDVSSCSFSCKELSGDVRAIIEQGMAEFEKLLRIAVAFLTKLAGKF